MGYDFFENRMTKRQLIAELTAPEDTGVSIRRTLRYCLRGNVLWAVIEDTPYGADRGKRRIVCHLLSASAGCWGYKTITESMYPYYYSCPTGYFDECPEASREWRQAVIKRRAQKLARRKAIHAALAAIG